MVGMPSVRRTVTVRPPLERVRDYLRDFGHVVEWDPPTSEVEQITPGPVQTGTEWRVVTTFKGRRSTLVYKLTGDAPRTLIFVGTNKTVTATDEIGLRAVPAGTEVDYQARLDFHGLAKLVGPLLGREFERIADGTAVRLVQVLNGLTD